MVDVGKGADEDVESLLLLEPPDRADERTRAEPRAGGVIAVGDAVVDRSDRAGRKPDEDLDLAGRSLPHSDVTITPRIVTPFARL